VVVVVATTGAPPRKMPPWFAGVHLENLDVLLAVHVLLLHPPVQPIPSTKFQSDCKVVFLKMQLLGCRTRWDESCAYNLTRSPHQLNLTDETVFSLIFIAQWADLECTTWLS
jgi:hypothetical protein